MKTMPPGRRTRAASARQAIEQAVAQAVVEHHGIKTARGERQRVNVGADLRHSGRRHLQLSAADVEQGKAQVGADPGHHLGHGPHSAPCVEHAGSLRRGKAVQQSRDVIAVSGRQLVRLQDPRAMTDEHPRHMAHPRIVAIRRDRASALKVAQQAMGVVVCIRRSPTQSRQARPRDQCTGQRPRHRRRSCSIPVGCRCRASGRPGTCFGSAAPCP